ncbi:mitochondrial inner membrane protein translocase, 9kD-subunit [Culex quinquefasciatus]|uniref:Mitochondrial import inner membrane translocase subunit n=1 Tax=Culex quinquefasciatus TaxID=7176 RepID=B0WVB3_CULQU|nr:mitochondrial inner membrane protein translocase, 9kD-subunit [Culex quinquefasciatus]|eukprot:XP_001861335.1 mitochondrial inner membrane protein translocase, 9kD-subunit [Culex quinquefasciatus]
MNIELRNLKDFLGLYNRVTELCFSSCVDNFNVRDLSPEEVRCAENCVGKFTNTNQRLMQVYMDVQGKINERRYAEVEALQAKQEAELLQQQQQQQQQQELADSQLPVDGGTSGDSGPEPANLTPVATN